MKQYQADFSLNRKQRSRLVYVICVQYTRFWPGVWKLLSGQIVNSFGHGRCTFDYQSGKVKNYAMSQRAHACWELREWSPSTWLVCGHFIRIYSCMGICFSCMYTNNSDEHLQEWFGPVSSDSVVMKALIFNIIISHDHFHNSHEMHP